MKILFLSDLLAYGGASKLIYDLLPRMVEQGNECEITILTDDHSKYIDQLRSKGIPVNVVPKEAKGHIARIAFIKEQIQNGQYDIVHANLFPVIYYAAIVKQLLGAKCPPLVMTEHSTDNKRRHHRFFRPIEKYIYRKYDHIISISDKTQEKLCEWLNRKADNSFSIIENGIDLTMFQNAEAVEREALCNSTEENDILLLMVGSFTQQKNHDRMIEALSLLPEKFKLLFLGEGPLLESVKQKVCEYHIEHRTVFLGFRRDVARIMHTADVLVIPSLWEGFGLIAAEGMACGIPIAASDVPGLSEIIGNIGVKFSPYNAQDMANKIKMATEYINDCSYREKSIQRSLRYDINLTVSKYLDLYKRLK